MDQIEAKKWKIQLDPKHPIIIREQINRIVKTVKKFSGIFAVAASFDPVHAGAAWAGVSAILPVRTHTLFGIQGSYPNIPLADRHSSCSIFPLKMRL
jgi:hypothetical protein